MQERAISIFFLDIHLPVLDGIGLLQRLKIRPQVIMTTAYKEYAVDAFNLAVCDYLVKPFSLERFIMAIDKATENIKYRSNHADFKAGDHHVFIKTEGMIYRVKYDDLLFAEASRKYTKIVTIDKILLPMMPFSVLDNKYPLVNSLGFTVHLLSTNQRLPALMLTGFLLVNRQYLSVKIPG